MFTINITEEQRLQKAVVAVLNHERYVAMAGIIMIGERTVDDNTPTACTNGRDEKYGREFLRSLRDSDIRGVLIHENKHKMYRHLITWKNLHDIDHKRANMACDYVINLEIVDENPDGFATLPDFALLDPQYRGMSAAQVFAALPPQSNEGEGEGEGEGGGSLDEHDWDGAEDMTAEEQRELEREIDQAIRQGVLASDKLGAKAPLGMRELLEPQVDWRDVLRDFVTSTCAGKDLSTWRKPNRRYLSHNIYMPSSISEQVEELAVLIDTSGSIAHELHSFLTELVNICETVRPQRVRLLYWGTQVAGDETYEAHELDGILHSTNPRSGGGTDVNCACRYMSEQGIKPQAVVVFTDGHLFGDWGTWTAPVLWCVIDNPHAKPDSGQTVHIKSV